jgi:hypothetical protein
MSHITCPYCGSNDHTSGYGLAAGPMGSYTFCNKCNELIEFSADTEGMSEDQIQRLQKMGEELKTKLAEAAAKRVP